jgi:hypothetical protein
MGRKRAETVADANERLRRMLAEWPIGQPAALAVLRGRERVTISVVPVEAGT